MPANGYLAVYLSNKTASTCIPCADVYFDLLTVRFTRGNLLEETHYYPHGLPIYGLSGRTATGFQDNRRKYQSNEYIKDLGLNWMDFDARQYDPQIGRFLSVDPLADGGGQQLWSPYAAMGNAPESMIDPNGMLARPGGTLDFRTKNMIDMAVAWDWRGGKWSPFFDLAASDLFSNGGPTGNWSMGNSFAMNFQFELEAERRMKDREKEKSGSVSAGEPQGSFQDQQFDKNPKAAYGWRTMVINGTTFEYRIEGDVTNTSGGVGIKFEMYTKGTTGYSDLDFIQNLWSNSPADIGDGNENVRRWDGNKNNPNKPFYWSKQERNATIETHAKPNGFSNYFSDSPGRHRGSESYVWFAELSLVGRKNGQFQNIATFVWGYMYVNRTAIPIGPFPTLPSNFQQQQINSAK